MIGTRAYSPYCQGLLVGNITYVLPLNLSLIDLILSSQYELVYNVKVHEPLGSRDHNQIHFNIEVKTGNTYKKQ